MCTRLLLAFLLLCLSGILVLTLPSTVSSSGLGVFIDWDGDGFDDNAPDDDTDGIPDEFERHGYISSQTAQLQVSQLFAGDVPASVAPDRPGQGEVFGRRSFATRSVSENRADFDNGFGSVLGLGAGLGAGGGCAGGVCR